MNPFDFFDNIYYINLASRPDRRAATEQQFLLNNITAKRVEAIAGDNKHLAFNASQHKALSEAEGDRMLVFEDDVMIKNTFHLQQSIDQLPSDWDILSLGANILEYGSSEYSPFLRRLHSSWTTHAVAYSRKCIDFILASYSYKDFPIYDEWVRVNVLPVKQCFITNPMVADQRPGFSDIWQEEVSYGFFDKWKMRV